MKIEVDEWLISTRTRLCKATTCRFNTRPVSLGCNLRMIEIEEGGKCRQFEPRQKDA